MFIFFVIIPHVLAADPLITYWAIFRHGLNETSLKLGSDILYLSHMRNTAGDSLRQTSVTTEKSPEHSGDWRHLGGAWRRQDMMYKFCWGNHMFLFPAHRRRPSSPKALESCCLFKVTTSTCMTPLLHPEILVFFQFCVRHVLETPSTGQLAWIHCTFTCCILTWAHSEIFRTFYVEASGNSSKTCLE